MVEENGMEEEIYKTIKDLTQEVIKYSQKIYNFPQEIKITDAKLLIGPDGWGGSMYYLRVGYEVDGVECKELRSIWANLTSVVSDILFSIKDSYERTHIIK